MNPILSAFLVIGGFGLFFALVLVISSIFFHVEEDEKVKEIRECLPGANCGACGFSGCDSFASALANGECDPGLCVPGAADVAKKLSEVLGISVETKISKFAFVKCNGDCSATTKKAIFDGADSCKSASLLFAGPNDCQFGCVGCGDCASACPSNAICIDDGIARVNYNICTGCGLCTTVCPKGIIELYDRDIKVSVMCSSHEKGAVARKKCTNACIGCKKCELDCQEGAIMVVNNLPVIDHSACVGCGKCVESCPVKCIKEVNITTYTDGIV